METTVSTTAFDTVVVSDTSTCIWTVRGFVSGDQCGFDLIVVATDAAPDALLELPSRVRWWDLDSVRDSFPMSLTADATNIPLSLASTGSHGSQDGGGLRSTISVIFPTPGDCNALILTVNTELWSVPKQVSFDPFELSDSLAKWKLRHSGA
jgi:hypothetical protein